MTVECEHVYRVSTLGVLVHNNGWRQPAPISMDEALDLAQGHVGPGGVIIEQTGKRTNYQFRGVTIDGAGNNTTKIARFDINPADPHVAASGPHLNLETQVNGRIRTNTHLPIDPSTIRPGDFPLQPGDSP